MNEVTQAIAALPAPVARMLAVETSCWPPPRLSATTCSKRAFTFSGKSSEPREQPRN